MSIEHVNKGSELSLTRCRTPEDRSDVRFTVGGLQQFVMEAQVHGAAETTPITFRHTDARRVDAIFVELDHQIERTPLGDRSLAEVWSAIAMTPKLLMLVLFVAGFVTGGLFL